MISYWRSKRKAGRRARMSKQHVEDELTSCMELTTPNHFRCPISLDLMKDPVTLSTGITYDRDSIETWIDSGNKTCPITNQVLTSYDPIPNHTIRKMIQDWCVEKRLFGIERIPTPRIPVSSIQVLEILNKIIMSCELQDRAKCVEMAKKVKNLAKESERNKKCILSNRTPAVLASTFVAFSEAPFDKNSSVLEELLSALTIITDSEAKSILGSSFSSLQSMIWLLNSGNCSTATNAVLLLKNILHQDQSKSAELNRIEGAKEALINLIKDPICPTTTRSSLITIFYIISSTSTSSSSNQDKNKIIESFVTLGLTPLLLELLVDSDRNTNEKALAVLDKTCIAEIGRRRAFENALTIPVLVKKILRVSDLATELSVSVMWKLFMTSGSGGTSSNSHGGAIEALQVGAFQKLLLVLQVGCGDKTKDKATDLLKVLNVFRGKVDFCVDSSDFKDVKRAF